MKRLQMTWWEWPIASFGVKHSTRVKLYVLYAVKKDEYQTCKSHTVLSALRPTMLCVMRCMPTRFARNSSRVLNGACLGSRAVTCIQMHTHHSSFYRALYSQFGTNPRESGLGRIVTPAHAQRQIDMIQEVEGSATILCGGSALCDADDRYVCPTVVLNPPRECRLLQEEIFGPILPVIIVQSREQAIEFINERVRTTEMAYSLHLCFD